MKLYGYWRSSASTRIRIALALKGIEVEHIAVNLRSGEHGETAHLARNPQGFVPVLELEDGTQLTQSLAILDYLDAAYPDMNLLPRDPVLRAKILSAALVIAADIAPLQNSSVQKFIQTEYSQNSDGAAEWAAHWISKGFMALEKIAAKSDTPFLLTERPMFFECCLIPQAYNARRFGVDMSAFPHLSAIDARCRELPAFVKSAPDNQPDAPKN